MAGLSSSLLDANKMGRLGSPSLLHFILRRMPSPASPSLGALPPAGPVAIAALGMALMPSCSDGMPGKRNEADNSSPFSAKSATKSLG